MLNQQFGFCVNLSSWQILFVSVFLFKFWMKFLLTTLSFLFPELLPCFESAPHNLESNSIVLFCCCLLQTAPNPPPRLHPPHLTELWWFRRQSHMWYVFVTCTVALSLDFLTERELGHVLSFILHILCCKCHVDTFHITSHPYIDAAKGLMFFTSCLS